MDNLERSGISPAVGVILLIGITAAVATLAGIVLLDIGNLQETTTSGVEVTETPDGIEVSWNQQGNAESIQVQVDGETVGTLHKVNDNMNLTTRDGSTVSIIGVTTDGEESTISSVETENDTGETEVTEYNSNPDETVSGSLSINPDIPNATVQAIENGNIIDSTTTDSNGEFTVKAYDSSRLVFHVKGFTYNDSGGTDREVYTSIVRDADIENTVDVEVPENFQQVTIDGSTVDVVYETDTNGFKQIGSMEQLQGIKADKSADYKLITDIDASSSNSWNSGSGFDPIGEYKDGFKGVLDGNGYKIKNLTISRPSSADVGLISAAEGSSEFKNITLKNVDITGNVGTGGLVGYAYSSTITESSVTGSVKGSDYTGLLTGGITGKISDSYSKGTVIVDESDTKFSAGGLVGYVFGDVNSSYSTADVDANADSVGGLVGAGEGDITNSYATGNVEATGSSSFNALAGGLVGDLTGSITDSYAKGNVTADSSVVGGLAGDITSGSVTESYATGNVTGTDKTGGLVGVAEGTVSDSYAEGSVTSSGDDVGGLVGVNGGTVQTSYASGSVSGDTNVGGLVGQNGEDASDFSAGENGTLEDVYWDKDVSVSTAIGKEGGDDSDDGTNSGGSSITNGVVSGLTTSEMTGEDASTNMSVFNFDSVWTTTDEYPQLQE